MESNKISIIIPVYNVKPYLERCLESVIKQTYGNLEIIIVDDGSTDGGQFLCDEYAKKDSRIKVIHQKNQGLAVARNSGLNVASGQWVAFLDSDDWVAHDMYEELLKAALHNKAEISSCLSRNYYGNENPVINQSEDGETIILNRHEIICGLISKKIMRFEVWNKLWNRELIGDVRYIPGQVSEDIHFDRILFLRAKRIAHVNKGLHFYTASRPGNTTSSFKLARMCVFEEFDAFIKDLISLEERIVIANIGVKFAINMYDEAYWSKVPSSVLQELKKQFNRFYSQINRNYLIGKIKVELFRLSPNLYCFVSRIKKVLSL